jgi:parallel beta-helix repeat protein
MKMNHTVEIKRRESFKFHFLIFIISIININSIQIIAQPSGGPYGPIQQTYELPKSVNQIYYVAADGKPENSGNTISNPTTIEAAIEKVKTGDAIIMRGGVYRTGNLILNQGITIQPYKDEQPILKGTFIASEWTNLGNGLWITSWSRLFPSKPADWWRRNREGKKTPQHRFNNDMVFADGKFLQSAGWEGEVDNDTYYIDYETGLVYIGVDPQKHQIEITAYDAALIRTIKDVHGKKSDRIGPTIRGIVFTQYAYRAIEIEGTDPEGLSPEANHGKEVVGSTFENCTITYCSRVAGYFRGDKMTFRNCLISDTSTEGIYILSSNDVLLEKNLIRRNNIERITGYYPAAVKIFNQCYRVTCNDNLVIEHPYSNGIWYDVGNVDGVFINNWIEGVGNIKSNFNINQPWPSDNGFFFEISQNAICAGNVFVNCDHGIWVLNSSDVHIYNNTFINSTACIARNERSAQGDHFGWHPSTGPDVDARDGHIFVNNIMTADSDFDRPLFYVWQPASLCEKVNNSQLEQLDYNVYVRESEKYSAPLILWSPANNNICQLGINFLEELNKLYPAFSLNSKYYSEYNGPLFKGFYLNNYQLLEKFPGAYKAKKTPTNISKLINQTKPYVGAYPPVK